MMVLDFCCDIDYVSIMLLGITQCLCRTSLVMRYIEYG